MGKLRKNKGITLIALVITIIVLLILAGVTIATLTGDNGILTKTNNAKAETERAGEDEKLKLAIMGSYGLDGKLNLEDLKRNLTEQGISYTDSSGFPLTATVNGESIEIKEDGKQEKLFNATEWDKTATPEDCFIWESNIPGEDGYNTIIGYTSNLTSYTKVRIPSRCQRIRGRVGQEPEDEQVGRVFFTGVEKIEIPNTVEEIGMYAFWSGVHGLEYSLKEVTIPSSVTSIGHRAFCNCKNLKSITIPNSVMNIETWAFEGWTSSQTINIQGYTSAPSGWNSSWDRGCSATINWNQ